MAIQKILIGEIVAPIGIKGEVKIKSYSDTPERFGVLDFVTVNDVEFKIQKARSQGNMAVVKFVGVDDRNAAEELRNSNVYIDETDLEELPEDSYYVKDLIGLSVYDFSNKSDFGIGNSEERVPNQEPGDGSRVDPVGRIKDVLQNGPQDIYVIDVNGTDVLVPAVKEFIKKVDIAKGEITIAFIDGMLPEK